MCQAFGHPCRTRDDVDHYQVQPVRETVDINRVWHVLFHRCLLPVELPRHDASPIVALTNTGIQVHPVFCQSFHDLGRKASSILTVRRRREAQEYLLHVFRGLVVEAQTYAHLFFLGDILGFIADQTVENSIG